MTATPICAGAPLTGGLREGRVGAVARTSHGQLVAVTAKRIFESSVSEGRRELQANDLLVAFPITGASGSTHQPRSILQASATLGQAVFRQVDDAGRTPGRVSALYGSVIASNNTGVRIRGLIQVSFAETSKRSTATLPMPPVNENELGKLVMNYEGAAVGLIVGGDGYLAVVAPLYSFFQEYKLELHPSEFSVSDLGVGLDLIYNDLNQVPMLDLGEMPEAA